MYSIIFLLIITVAGIWLTIIFWRFQESRRIKLNNEIESLQNSCSQLQQKIEAVEEDNVQQEGKLSSIIALYDLTREINKSLKPQEIQNMFKEMLRKYVKYDECQFVERQPSQYHFQKQEAFELDLGAKKQVLVVSGIDSEDKEVCSILRNQLVLGLRRAYLYEEVQRLAITDELCGIFSRRYVLERLQEELVRSGQFKLSFSVLMVDLDNFKDINDIYGHLVGDVVLKECSRVIKDNLRQIDLIGRFGGEEFIIVLTETSMDKAKIVAERIREAIESSRFRAYDETVRSRVSIGISNFPNDAHNIQDLIDKADSALYTAKRKGRNVTCVFGEDCMRRPA